LLAGDVLGSSRPEIVVIGEEATLIANLRGRVLREISHGGVRRTPGFLMDFDSDGKLDIVLGSAATALPDISVYNASGSRLHRFAVPDPTRAYDSMTPLFEHDGNILIATSPSYFMMPRGLISYSRQAQQEEWEFHLPSMPGRARLSSTSAGKRYLLSNGTLNSGEFKRFGKNETVPAGFDRNLYTLTVTPSGTIDVLEPIIVDGQPLTGTAELYPTPAGDDITVVHRADDPGAERGSDSVLVVATPSGAVVEHIDLGPHRIQGIRLLSNGDVRRVVLAKTEGGVTLSILDADLRPLSVHDFDGVEASLGPVIVEPDDGTTDGATTEEFVLASIGDGLYAVSSRVTRVATPGHLRAIIGLATGTDLMIAGIRDDELLTLAASGTR
jgi:hypothetical protein